MTENDRLTDSRYKALGFHAYTGKENPYNAPLTLGEIQLSDAETMPKFSGREILNEVFGKLAEYEDLRLSPSEITDMQAKLKRYEDAETEGRMIVLPCWGKVYIHSEGVAQEMLMCHYRGNADGIYDMRCECVNQHEECDTLCGNKNGEVCAYNFRIAEIGKTVFLSQADAQAALEVTP